MERIARTTGSSSICMGGAVGIAIKKKSNKTRFKVAFLAFKIYIYSHKKVLSILRGSMPPPMAGHE